MDSSRIILPLSLLTIASVATAQDFDKRSCGQGSAYVQNKTVTATTRSTEIPGLGRYIRTELGGRLAATFSAHVYSGYLSANMTRVRVLAELVVDGTGQGEKVLRDGPDATGAYTSTCNLFARDLAPGIHRIGIRWRVGGDYGAWARLDAATLTYQYASKLSSYMQIAHQDGKSATVTAGGWRDISGGTVTLTHAALMRYEIRVAGRFSGRRTWVRAVVDGRGTKDTVMAAAKSSQLRTFTFAPATFMAPGKHSVRFQWTGGRVDQPSITVVAHNPYAGSKLATLFRSPPGWPLVRTTSSSFRTIPGLSGRIFVPDNGCDVLVRFAGEIGNSGSGYFRIKARLDNRDGFGPAYDPVRYQSNYASGEVVFVIPGVSRGWHDVAVQWARGWGTPAIGERTMSVAATYPHAWCSRTLGMSPKTVPNAGGYVDIKMDNSASVKSVTVAGRRLTDALRDEIAGFFETPRLDTVRVHLPWGLPRGNANIQVQAGACATLNAGTVFVDFPVHPSLRTTSRLNVPGTQYLYISAGQARSGTATVPVISHSPIPSLWPGLVSLSLGNGFREFFLLAPAPISGSTKTAVIKFSAPAALNGQRLYMQSLIIEPGILPWKVTNRTATDYKKGVIR